MTQAQLWAPLRVKPEAALYWRQSTGLFVHQPMAKGKSAVGTIAVNIQLTAIDALLEDHTGLGASGAMGLCAPLPGQRMQCLPNRANQYQVLKRARLLGDEPVPMSYALDGQQGIVRAPDSQGRRVIAAHAPIGDFGLGMVVRVRTADLYQPIHMQLRYMLLWLLALVFGGLALLRWQLAPLVRRLVHEVHERRVAEGRLQHLAHHDVLTGLPNRALQHAHLQQAMAEANRLNRLAAVMFLDLDRFKVINDTLGHGMGDALLKEVAVRLSDSIRPGDIVARVGGDEFTVILGTLAHLDDATLVARKILARFNDPFRVDGRELFVSPSIGITLYPHDGNDADTLLRNADAAMYHAKESGRNTFRFFIPALNERASRRFALETALHQALARNEFVLHYQPLVDMATGRIRGVEALLRWRHPETGLVPPLEFIPVAEETGLIAPIGDWVLRTACAQMRAWHAAGHPPLHVSVNLSGKQMGPDLPGKVRDILDTTGLAPEYLDLEITESILFQDVEETVTVMQDLHAMGISLSLDDFGTGYSSLSYLRRLPIRYLKIDRSFVRDILGDPNDAAIVSAIIAMARALNLEVIAEGVESYEQLKFLRAQGCDITQGYFCSKPLDTGELTELLEVWKNLNQGKCRALAGDNRGKTARGRNGAGTRRRPPATKSR